MIEGEQDRTTGRSAIALDHLLLLSSVPAVYQRSVIFGVPSRHLPIRVPLHNTLACRRWACRHYSTLIVRLQMEMRVELRRLAKERKEQDELVENLRDKIATVTVWVSQSPMTLW